MKLPPFVSVATREDEAELISIIEYAYRGRGEDQDKHEEEEDVQIEGWTHEKGIIAEPRINRENPWEFIPTETANILKCQREIGGEILGCVRVELEENQKDEEDETETTGTSSGSGIKCFFMLLSVHPKEQGKGIGSTLLDGVEDWAKERNCRRIEMSVVSVRPALIEFYKRRGYRETGERKPFTIRKGYGPNLVPLEFILFEKQL